MNIYYTTKKEKNKYVKLSRNFMSILNGPAIAQDTTKKEYTFKQYVDRHNYWRDDMHITVSSTIDDVPNAYYSFKIPKKTGGYRQIDAPSDALKLIQLEILKQLKKACPYPHNCAHAYTENKSTLTAMQTHIKNNSHWYLKIDLSSFFPSCTEELVMNKLVEVYPFYKLTPEAKGTILKYCFLNGSLPQGAPTSPYLSNIIMVPFDYAVTEYCSQHSLIYTRYADDIIISGYEKFDYKKVIEQIEFILTVQYPTLKINPNKIRFGNAAGKNWNLGLMVAGNKLTVGNQRKRQLKQSLYNYKKTKDSWTINDLQSLLGELQYIINVEPTIYETMYMPKYGDVRKEIIEQIKTLSRV